MALARHGVPHFDTLADIYGQADGQFLMTLPVLDHFGERAGQRYLGVEPTRPHQLPQWPPGCGPKIFGYLRAIPALELLLQDLQAAKVCALLHVRGLPPVLRDAYTSEHLHFTDQLLDLSKVAEQAAWVINHGNHGTVAAFLRSGVPQLLIPIHQEHFFVALRLVAKGCVVMAYQDQSGFAKEIEDLLSNPLIRQRARLIQAQCPSHESLDAAGFIKQTFQALLV